jgi:hypothetical protein
MREDTAERRESEKEGKGKGAVRKILMIPTAIAT